MMMVGVGPGRLDLWLSVGGSNAVCCPCVVKLEEAFTSPLSPLFLLGHYPAPASSNNAYCCLLTHPQFPPTLPPSLSPLLSSALYYDGTERDCLLAVFSLDKTLLAIQRNRYWVEVRREGGREGGRKGRGWVGVSAHIAWLTLSASFIPIPVSSVAFIPPSLPPLPPLPLGH